jgi:putative ABC transport system permease protein
MQFSEIIKIALTSVRANKLRSALTLLGIVVGVFSIIGVMTAVQVLQNSIETGLSALGAHTFQIQKMPMMASRREWLKARARKELTIEQAEYVRDRLSLAKLIGLEVGDGGKVVQSLTGERTNPNVQIMAETVDGIPTNNWTVEEGRALNEDDVRRGRNVAILGVDVVKKVFPRGNPIDQEVKIDGYRYTVIGTFEKSGASMGGSSDNFVVVPLSKYLDLYGRNQSVHIMIKSATAEVYDDCMEEARSILRTVRKVSPADEDDFYIFSNDSMIETFNGFTKYVKLGVGFISFVSLLAAGIGIMNIMLVSVTERTKEIGIRKAIGAQKKSILGQFIAEAIVLCQLGGIVGIALGILAGNLTALLMNFPAVMPWDWAFIGFALCAFIGIVFGVYPAWKAANLDPIEALRYE